MERFEPKLSAKDRMQMRINALSNPVRNYLALSEAITFDIDEETKGQLQEARLKLLGEFEDTHRDELGKFISFRDSLNPPRRV